MDAATITQAGLAVLDAQGLDGLSMRAVASHLGVQVGGLYYYVQSKAELLRAMADALCRQAMDGLMSTGRWQQDASLLCHSLRAALSEHRDGARLLAQAPLLGSREALAMMERLMELMSGGLAATQVTAASDTLMSYVTGFALQEQLRLATTYSDDEITDLTRQFPRVFAGAAASSTDADFAAAIYAIITGFAHVDRD